MPAPKSRSDYLDALLRSKEGRPERPRYARIYREIDALLARAFRSVEALAGPQGPVEPFEGDAVLAYTTHCRRAWNGFPSVQGSVYREAPVRPTPAPFPFPYAYSELVRALDDYVEALLGYVEYAETHLLLVEEALRVSAAVGAISGIFDCGVLESRLRVDWAHPRGAEHGREGRLCLFQDDPKGTPQLAWRLVDHGLHFGASSNYTADQIRSMGVGFQPSEP